jgi:hypothetical protein
MVRKFFLAFLIVTEFAVAGKNPFSTVRTLSFDESGNPLEEAIDLVVCLERNPVVGNPSDINSRERYENIIKYWADGIYELSNGANFLGHIRIFTGGDFLTGCDVIWKKEGVWPNANAGAFNHGGSLQISDYFSFSPDVDQRLGNNKIDFAMTLTHESMHYIYGLYDEYGSVDLNPLEIGIRLSVDSPDGWIRIEKGDLTLNKFKLMMEAYQVGTLVKFQNLGGRPYRINA